MNYDLYILDWQFHQGIFHTVPVVARFREPMKSSLPLSSSAAREEAYSDPGPRIYYSSEYRKVNV